MSATRRCSGGRDVGARQRRCCALWRDEFLMAEAAFLTNRSKKGISFLEVKGVQMARPKEFDRDEALQKAMEVFWSRGYEAASINDLVKHMGINRQSLYDTFGDKHALYLQALDRYREVEGRKMFELLEQPGSVKKSLRQLFEGTVEKALCDEQRRGCF